MTSVPGTPWTPPMVVVGASAGGVEALQHFVAGLPTDLSAAVLVVLHVPPDSSSALSAILRRRSPLPVRSAVDGERLEAGTVVVAAPNHHLVVIDGATALTHGPTENGHRPAIDVLFRSAARAADSRTIGVVLSGTLDDGAAGCAAIVAQGGRVMVQDSADALYASMPEAAARAAEAETRLPASAMGAVLSEWVERLPAAGRTVTAPETMEEEVAMADLDADAMHDPERPGVPAGFGCPDCAGALFLIEEGNVRRYRCRVGHAWSPESLLAQQTVAMESALWMALRSLEEKAALNTDLGQQAAGRGHDLAAARFAEHARETLHAAELVRRLIDDVGSAAQVTDMR